MRKRRDNSVIEAGEEDEGCEDDGHLIEVQDLSTNGTFVENERIGKGNVRILKHGDVITLLMPQNFLAKEEMEEPVHMYLFQDMRM